MNTENLQSLKMDTVKYPYIQCLAINATQIVCSVFIIARQIKKEKEKKNV